MIEVSFWYGLSRERATLPSSARAQGLNGAFYTTDVTVSNVGSSSANLTFKFLGNNKDGTPGVEKTYTVGAGKTQTFSDILGSVFGRNSDYGAISISSAFIRACCVRSNLNPGLRWHLWPKCSSLDLLQP